MLSDNLAKWIFVIMLVLQSFTAISATKRNHQWKTRDRRGFRYPPSSFSYQPFGVGGRGLGGETMARMTLSNKEHLTPPTTTHLHHHHYLATASSPSMYRPAAPFFGRQLAPPVPGVPLALPSTSASPFRTKLTKQFIFSSQPRPLPRSRMPFQVVYLPPRPALRHNPPPPPPPFPLAPLPRVPEPANPEQISNSIFSLPDNLNKNLWLYFAKVPVFRLLRPNLSTNIQAPPARPFHHPMQPAIEGLDKPLAPKTDVITSTSTSTSSTTTTTTIKPNEAALNPQDKALTNDTVKAVGDVPKEPPVVEKPSAAVDNVKDTIEPLSGQVSTMKPNLETELAAHPEESGSQVTSKRSPTTEKPPLPQPPMSRKSKALSSNVKNQEKSITTTTEMTVTTERTTEKSSQEPVTKSPAAKRSRKRSKPRSSTTLRPGNTGDQNQAKAKRPRNTNSRKPKRMRRKNRPSTETEPKESKRPSMVTITDDAEAIAESKIHTTTVDDLGSATQDSVSLDTKKQDMMAATEDSVQKINSTDEDSTESTTEAINEFSTSSATEDPTTGDVTDASEGATEDYPEDDATDLSPRFSRSEKQYLEKEGEKIQKVASMKDISSAVLNKMTDKQKVRLIQQMLRSMDKIPKYLDVDEEIKGEVDEDEGSQIFEERHETNEDTSPDDYYETETEESEVGPAEEEDEYTDNDYYTTVDDNLDDNEKSHQNDEMMHENEKHYAVEETDSDDYYTTPSYEYFEEAAEAVEDKLT